MKKLSALLLVFAMLFSFAACTDGAGEEVELNTNPPETSAVAERENKIRIATGNDPMALGFAKLSVDRAYAYDVEICDSAEAAIELFKAGKADILSVSLDTAARLYNEIGGIEMLAINTLGMVYVLSTDSELETLAGLKGKTVYCPSDKADVCAIFAKALQVSGVSDVDIQYKTADEIREGMIAGTIENCVLPEYNATGTIARMSEESTVSVVAAANEWEEQSGYKLAQGCIVAKKDYVEKNTDLIEEFLGFYEVSINYLGKNITNAALFLKDNNFFSDSELAKALITNCNLGFVSGEEMKELAKKNLKALVSVDEDILSGSVPADDFYYVA